MKPEKLSAIGDLFKGNPRRLSDGVLICLPPLFAAWKLLGADPEGGKKAASRAPQPVRRPAAAAILATAA